MSLPAPPPGCQLLPSSEIGRMKRSQFTAPQSAWIFSDWRPTLLRDGYRWCPLKARWEPGPFHFLWWHEQYAVPARGAQWEGQS